MEVNFIKLLFSFLTISVGISCLLILSKETILPLFFIRSFRYGKYAENAQHKIVELLELPKKYFKHFYIFSAPFSTITLFITIRKYFFNSELADIYTGLDFILGPSRRPLVLPEATTIAIVLMTMQCWKRLYETHCVSVFSNAKMNFSHYLAGYIHYFGAVTSIIGESRGFVKGTHDHFQWHRIKNIHLFLAVIFLLTSYEQLRTNFILANLRKNKQGQVVTKSYQLPKGELFEYISSPLQFTEIIMYVMLSCILWSSSTFHYVTVWVIINQVAAALLNYQWYQKTFKDFPKNRKILIPLVI